MIEIAPFTERFLQALKTAFPERIAFVGLQGSYARGEAAEGSDIDFVVILDALSAADIATYNKMLDTLPHRELICGFLSGKEEIANWEPADLLQFYCDTKPIVGSLDKLMTPPDKDAIDRAIKMSACNVYHGCVHNMLYEKSDEILRGLYKSAVFTVQAICFQQTGNYIPRHRDLPAAVSSEGKQIIDTYLRLKNGEAVQFREMSEALFAWAQKQIH